MTDRTDWIPLRVLPPEDGIVIAVSCVADAFTMRRSIIVKPTHDGLYTVHERTEAPEPEAGALYNGSYDLTLGQALEEAAQRLKREERYLR
jgi:hypothetical protein